MSQFHMLLALAVVVAIASLTVPASATCAQLKANNTVLKGTLTVENCTLKDIVAHVEANATNRLDMTFTNVTWVGGGINVSASSEIHVILRGPDNSFSALQFGCLVLLKSAFWTRSFNLSHCTVNDVHLESGNVLMALHLSHITWTKGSFKITKVTDILVDVADSTFVNMSDSTVSIMGILPPIRNVTLRLRRVTIKSSAGYVASIVHTSGNYPSINDATVSVTDNSVLEVDGTTGYTGAGACAIALSHQGFASGSVSNRLRIELLDSIASVRQQSNHVAVAGLAIRRAMNMEYANITIAVERSTVTAVSKSNSVAGGVLHSSPYGICTVKDSTFSIRDSTVDVTGDETSAVAAVASTDALTTVNTTAVVRDSTLTCHARTSLSIVGGVGTSATLTSTNATVTIRKSKVDASTASSWAACGGILGNAVTSTRTVVEVDGTTLNCSVGAARLAVVAVVGDRSVNASSLKLSSRNTNVTATANTTAVAIGVAATNVTLGDATLFCAGSDINTTVTTHGTSVGVHSGMNISATRVSVGVYDSTVSALSTVNHGPAVSVALASRSANCNSQSATMTDIDFIITGSTIKSTEVAMDLSTRCGATSDGLFTSRFTQRVAARWMVSMSKTTVETKLATPHGDCLVSLAALTTPQRPSILRDAKVICSGFSLVGAAAKSIYASGIRNSSGADVTRHVAPNAVTRCDVGPRPRLKCPTRTPTASLSKGQSVSITKSETVTPPPPTTLAPVVPPTTLAPSAPQSTAPQSTPANSSTLAQQLTESPISTMQATQLMTEPQTQVTTTNSPIAPTSSSSSHVVTNAPTVTPIPTLMPSAGELVLREYQIRLDGGGWGLLLNESVDAVMRAVRSDLTVILNITDDQLVNVTLRAGSLIVNFGILSNDTTADPANVAQLISSASFNASSTTYMTSTGSAYSINVTSVVVTNTGTVVVPQSPPPLLVDAPSLDGSSDDQTLGLAVGFGVGLPIFAGCIAAVAVFLRRRSKRDEVATM